MEHRAGSTQPVPKRRGSEESDDHWLDNLDLERSALPDDAEEPVETDTDAEVGEELEEDFGTEEDGDFHS